MEKKETEQGYGITNLLYYSQNQKVKELLKLPDYNYEVRYHPARWLFVWGCVQINDTVHDRAFWLFGEDQSMKKEKKINVDSTVKEMLQEMGLTDAFKGSLGKIGLHYKDGIVPKKDEKGNKQAMSYYAKEFSEGLYKKNQKDLRA